MDQNDQPVPNTPQTPPRQPLAMRLLGVRHRPGKRIAYVPNKWGIFVIVLLSMFVGGGAFAEYSMQPSFCNSCHIMEPYYKAWHLSTHKNVACVDCHFAPGLENTIKGKWQASAQAVKYITQTYGSKPHAQIDDAACLRSGCHETRLLEGGVKWEVRNEKGELVTIRFDHKPHLTQIRRGKQLRCTSCHSQIVQGQHITVTTDTCFLCHFKGLEHGRHEQAVGGCTGCHDAPKEQIRLATGMFNHSEYVGRGVNCTNCHSDTIKGDGAVPRQTCWTCHNQLAQVQRYDDTQFVHENHVSKHKLECSSCHIKIEHRLDATAADMAVTSKGAFVHGENGACNQCHEQMHGGPLQLYRGTGGRGVADMPSPMSRAQVDCIACHRGHRNTDSTASVVGQTYIAEKERCGYCHGEKYVGTLSEWKVAIADSQNKAETAFAKAKAAVDAANLTGTVLLDAQRLLDDAEHNIRLVKLGHGVHNVNYSTALLSVAVERCGTVMDSLAQRPPK